MKNLVGIKLKTSKKDSAGNPIYNNAVYTFRTDGLEVKKTDHVVCKTRNGLSEGIVHQIDVALPKNLTMDQIQPVLHIGTMDEYQSIMDKENVSNYDLIDDPIIKEITYFIDLLNIEEYTYESFWKKYNLLCSEADFTKQYKEIHKTVSNRYVNHVTYEVVWYRQDTDEMFKMYFNVPRKELGDSYTCTANTKRYNVVEKDKELLLQLYRKSDI